MKPSVKWQYPNFFLDLELKNCLDLELKNWAMLCFNKMIDASTYHIGIKKLVVSKMYQEMDDVVSQVTEARKLTRAINIFKHMKSIRNLDCRPSIRNDTILFVALLSL
ncbi:hypothetical protein PanWU01x14_337520 [Parasponia andersonii]|uniref:Pentatricopeptide repeat n=1 Tax=Parasponia andersonii TaxID=3476 RepID=A0A2P5AFL3_PARAD|nr:hypothetical protein PanWU01x14_337520 [Parasponia andersonii]